MELLEVLRKDDGTIIDSIKTSASTLLQLLFSMEHRPAFKQSIEVIEKNLFNIFVKIKFNFKPFQNIVSLIIKKTDEATLKSKSQILLTGMSKMGSPAGVRLAYAFARKLSPVFVLDQITSNHILGSKSSKVSKF